MAVTSTETGDGGHPCAAPVRPGGPPARDVLIARDELTCRIRDVLDRVGDKWSLAAVDQLGQGPHRFTELKRDIPGISQRMLTVTLRGLERDGLVTRTVHPVVPPRVDYELTTLGKTLLETAWALITWVVEHLEEIDEARARYDAVRVG